jgi:hypothetical protein
VANRDVELTIEWGRSRLKDSSALGIGKVHQGFML